MIRYRESPAGCIIYFLLSNLMNFLILILRISAHEISNNSTIASTTTQRLVTATVITIKSTAESNTEQSK